MDKESKRKLLDAIQNQLFKPNENDRDLAKRLGLPFIQVKTFKMYLDGDIDSISNGKLIDIASNLDIKFEIDLRF